MIIVLRPEATAQDAETLLARIADVGLKPLHMPGSERVVLGALGDERVIADLRLEGHPMVESIKPILAPYKLVSREMHPHDTIVRIGGLAIGVVPGMRGVYGGRLRNAHQVEALTANLISVNRRYKAHAGLRVTDV